MKIISWNVNSVRARITNIVDYIKQSNPDILFLQEIKTQDISFPYEDFKNWQFYIHHNQEDNLLAISGGRTFFLVNFGWDYPFYKVRLESCGYILRIPRGTFHRSVSDKNGSIVLNQAIRDKGGTVESEFKVTNSKDNKKLLDCISNLEPKFKIYSVK